jgi:hypothetical protein
VSENYSQLPLFHFDPTSVQLDSEPELAAAKAESAYSKYIVYVDESGDHGMQTIDE